MKRITFFFAFTCMLLFFLSGSFAQEKKPFPLYIEASFPFFLSDQGFLDSYETNTTFKSIGKSLGVTEIEELKFQVITLGWEIPRKGKITLTYTNYSEESSDTLINHLVRNGGSYIADELYDPDPFDDNYGSDPVNYLLKILDSDLGMKTDTFDVAFARGFGKGKRFGGAWNAGLRYAKHEQKLPLGYFYSYLDPQYGFSYKYFSPIPLIIYGEASFIGPKGGGEMYLFLFNRRLVLSAGADVSFTFGDVKVPTHSIPRLRGSYDENNNIIYNYEYFPFSETRSKSPFFTTVDFNIKFRILKELYVFVGYKHAFFRDVFLSPTIVELPTSKDQAPYGVFVSFSADDVDYQTPYFGMSYQF